MTQRYFVESPITSERALLEGGEAHHLLRVMRCQPGDSVVLFDGSGSEFTAEVASTTRTTVEMTILDRASVDRELPIDVTLGVTMPKGDRQRWLVEAATQLGVRRLVPLITEHSVVRPGGSSLSRLRRTVVEASKQCGRNRLMVIAEPVAWLEFVNKTHRTSADQPARVRRLLAHPLGGSAANRLPRLDDPPAQQAYLAVGPEGGLATHEVEAALTAGWQLVHLGPRILRIETAALAMIALATWR